MEMHQVRYFLAAARTLNFTRAAEECNVTQPSLTRAIQKLEEEFGGQLFRRERSLTHLTELGRQMVPHLQRTYDAAQAAKLGEGEYRLDELQPAAASPLKLLAQLFGKGAIKLGAFGEIKSLLAQLHQVRELRAASGWMNDPNGAYARCFCTVDLGGRHKLLP